jgi:peptide deformylase
MKKLELVTYPHTLLQKCLKPIKSFNDTLRGNIREMFRLMYENRGIGLAGNQAGLDARLIVINLSGDSEKLEEEMILINPEIRSHSRETLVEEEGCLSFPEIKVEVERKKQVIFSAQNEYGQELIYEAEGMFARCLQHELDHINGITFIDRLNPGQRALIRDKLLELEKLKA